MDFIAQTLDANSTVELAALKAGAEREAADSRVVTWFEDTVHVDERVEDVREFLADAAERPARIPHFVRVDAREDGENVQVLDWVTHNERGVGHPSRVVRVCFPPYRIAYRHLLLPPVAAVHTGLYTVTPDGGGAVAVSRHTVVVDESGITDLLGADADVAQAVTFARQALGKSSRAVLEAAREFAELRRRAR